ncbi:MAG: replication initiation protein, partial [Fusobacterium sp.]|nr:replication initiation protein [Fusobacterium sp.]
MDKAKELILYKPNEIIEVTNRPLSTMSWNAYTFILAKLQEAKSSKIIIPPAEILTAIGATNLHEELYKCLDELQKIQVKSIDKRGKSWGGFVLLSAFKKNDNGLYLEIPQLIADRMFKNEDLYYTTIKLLEEKAFKCTYSLVFYEIFKKYEKVSIPEYPLEVLRQLTKTENKYKVYADFKKRVIVPALKEINSFNNKYIYSFTEEYLGRKVDKIRFNRMDKTLEVKTEQAKTLPKLSEKLLLAIEKSKKNRFVQKKYSQRAVDNAVKQFGEDLVAKGLIKLYDFEKSISSFAKILNATIDDIKRSEAVKNQGINIQEHSEKAVKNEITGSEKLQNQENSFDKLLQMVSTQSTEQIKAFPTEKKVKFYTELAGTKNIEDLKKFCDKYNLIINL